MQWMGRMSFAVLRRCRSGGRSLAPFLDPLIYLLLAAVAISLLAWVSAMRSTFGFRLLGDFLVIDRSGFLLGAFFGLVQGSSPPLPSSTSCSLSYIRLWESASPPPARRPARAARIPAAELRPPDVAGDDRRAHRLRRDRRRLRLARELMLPAFLQDARRAHPSSMESAGSYCTIFVASGIASSGGARGVRQARSREPGAGLFRPS